MKYNTLFELRRMTSDMTMGQSNLEIGIQNAWQDWIDTSYAYTTTFNWRDFFDGCFVKLVDANRVVLVINRPDYFHMSEVDWFTEALENTFFITFRMPLHVHLETTEGLA